MKRFLMKSADTLHLGLWFICFDGDMAFLYRDILIFISHFLLRTSCLFNWHFYFPVDRTIYHNQKETRLCLAAESLTIIELRKALADPSCHLGA